MTPPANRIHLAHQIAAAIGVGWRELPDYERSTPDELLDAVRQMTLRHRLYWARIATDDPTRSQTPSHATWELVERYLGETLGLRDRILASYETDGTRVAGGSHG